MKKATEYETDWDAKVTVFQAKRRPLTADEKWVIDFIERGPDGRIKRKLTQQEINLSLLQAYMIGFGVDRLGCRQSRAAA